MPNEDLGHTALDLIDPTLVGLRGAWRHSFPDTFILDLAAGKWQCQQQSQFVLAPLNGETSGFESRYRRLTQQYLLTRTDFVGLTTTRLKISRPSLLCAYVTACSMNSHVLQARSSSASCSECSLGWLKKCPLWNWSWRILQQVPRALVRVTHC